MNSLLDRDSDTTIQQYCSNLVKQILWNLSTSMLVGKDGWEVPTSWTKELSPKILKEIKKTKYQYVNRGVKDPNICLNQLLSSLIASVLPGGSVIGNLKHSIGNLFSDGAISQEEIERYI